MSNPESLWQELFADDRETRAAKLDGEALADPTKPCSMTVELARFMAIMLEYDYGVYRPELLRTVRWLIEKCAGDVGGLRAVLEAKARDARWLAWATGEDVSIYAVRRMLADAYARRLKQGRERQFANTTEGRRARYASGRYAEFIMS